MDRVQLIHWKATESVERAERIRALGDTVDHQVPGVPASCASSLPIAQQPLWIAWPKRSSGVASDLTQQRVREVRTRGRLGRLQDLLNQWRLVGFAVHPT